MEDPRRELIDAVVAGDESACSELIRRAEPLIRGAMAGFWFESEGDREEVVQDIRIQLLKSAGRWDPSRGRFSTWVYPVARNICNSYVRKRRRRIPEVPLSDETAASSESVPPLGNDEPNVTESVLVSAFRRVYDRFSPDKRMVIDHMIRHADGMGGHADLAEALKVSEDAAKQRVYRMKKRLREAIEAELRPKRDLATNKEREQ